MSDDSGLILVKDEPAPDEGGGIVRVISLNREAKRNALTPAMLTTARGAFEQAGRDGAAGLVGAVLFEGVGRVFCAGFDLSMCQDDGPKQETLGKLLTELSVVIGAMRACSVPIVLAGHGAAIAGGCALLGGADVVVSDREAKLGYPVLRLGISPAVSAAYLRVGAGDGTARARLMDTELIDGARAEAVGLVHELVESREDVRERAMGIASVMASVPTSGIRSTKAWLNEVDGLGADDASRGLAVSTSLVGGEESRRMLAASWTR